jgi:hypothetical protein
MGNSFNFYQFEGLNIGVNRVTNLDDVTPLTNPYLYSFTGYYWPSDNQAGRIVGFRWSLFDELYYTFPKFSVKISGSQFSGQKDAIGCSWVLSGNLMPLFRDSGSLGINYSGENLSGQKDSTSIGINLSGTFLSGAKDTAYFGQNFSGELSANIAGTGRMSVFFSGEIISGTKDSMGISLGLSGALFKKDIDHADIDCNLVQILYGGGVFIHTIALEDEVSMIDMALNLISYVDHRP